MTERRLCASTQRRLRLGAVLAAAWILLGAAPVGAHEDVESSITADPGDPTTISGSANAGSLNKVTSIGLVLRPTGGQGAAEQSAARCEDECGPSTEFSWTVPVPYNGPYRVTATIEHCANLLVICSRHSTEVSHDFAVAEPPVPPENVRARAGADRKVTVSWDPVTAHPDLVGYVVLRRSGGRSFQPVDLLTSGETSYTDDQTALAGGKFDYQVASVREGSEPGVAEKWLTSGSDPVAIDVPAPPNPSTPPAGNNDSNPERGGAASSGPSADTLAAGSDLSSFLSSAAAGLSPPATSLGASITIPDTGFNQNLPLSGAKVDGRQPGRPSSASATGRVEEDDGGLSDSNRRALLVPVAAGSVLCVAALHLRWLNRRLLAATAGMGGGGADLEPAELDPEPEHEPDLQPEPEPEMVTPPREAVGAGAGGRGGSPPV